MHDEHRSLRRLIIGLYAGSLLVLCGAAGCATGSAESTDQDEAAAVEHPSSDTEELQYGNYSQAVENWATQIEWITGPFDERELRELSGEEIQTVLEQRDMAALLDGPVVTSELKIRELLEQPGAKGVHLVGRGEPLSDIEAIYVPFPESGGNLTENLAATYGPGMVLPLNRAGLSTYESPPDTEANLDRWPELDAERLGELLESGEPFIIYQHMTNCGGTPRGNRRLAALNLSDDIPLFVDHDFAALEAHIDDSRLRLPASSYLAFDDGEWVDFHSGGTPPFEETFDYFLQRVGVIDAGPTSPIVGPEAFRDDGDLALSLTWQNHWTALNLEGEDLRGMRNVRGAISGSNFRDADLRQTHFERTLISHSDFQGAQTEGATFEDVTLRSVTCIDGEVRSGSADGCLTAD